MIGGKETRVIRAARPHPGTRGSLASLAVLLLIVLVIYQGAQGEGVCTVPGWSWEADDREKVC